MTIPAGKTPISYLQEHCTEKKLTPEYEVVSHEGAVHEPTFVMRVKVGEYTADGKSNSKKKAKHAAARAVLSIIKGWQNGEPTTDDGAGETAVKEEEKGAGNPVGELQELTQKKLIRPPLYSFENDQRKPHERKFFCTVKLGKMVEQGEGRSKRMAKRDAAAAMLKRISKLSASGGDADHMLKTEAEADQEVPPSKNDTSYGGVTAKDDEDAEKKPPQPCLAPQQSRELQLFYEKVMQSAGKLLKSAGAPAPAANYCQMLQEVADTHQFSVVLFDMQERTTIGQYQTILKLDTDPLTVCHGLGISVEDARASAAYNALQYLRILKH